MAIRRRHIRSLVEQLLDREKIRTAPINVEQIARNLGLLITYRPAEDSHSGFLARTLDRKSPVIGINADHHPNRQRFTIAHEIAHFLLHEGESLHIDKGRRGYQVNRDTKSSDGTDKREIEANLFAAELLMPARFLDRDIVKYEGRDLMDEDVLRELAKTYKVSVQALTLRLSNLGYISQ